MNYRFSSIVGVVTLALAFGSCAPMPVSVKERPADLTVFFTSDTRGMLRRCGCTEGQMGGLSARAAYLKAQRGKGRMLVLDAGDSLFDGMETKEGAREFYKLKSRTIYKAMEQSGYDAASFGEYDFAYGPDFLKDAVKETSLSFVDSNLSVEAGSPEFRKGLVKGFHGLSVGVVGVLDSKFPYRSFKGSFDGVTVSAPLEAVKEEIRTISRRADIIIVLAHLSVASAEDFAKALPEADIVIQGHSQEILEAPVKTGNTLLVKGFNKGKRIGCLDLWLADGVRGGGRSGKVIKDYRYSVITISESMPPDPEVENIIAGYRAKLKEKALETDKAGMGEKGGYVGPDACKVCHVKEYRNWSDTKHAIAYSSLVKTGDQYDPECLPCHTTGYGHAEIENVTCESCHGSGAAHAAGNPPDKAGITRSVSEETCRGCHDDENSPGFQFERYKSLGGAHLGQ